MKEHPSPGQPRLPLTTEALQPMVGNKVSSEEGEREEEGSGRGRRRGRRRVRGRRRGTEAAKKNGIGLAR